MPKATAGQFESAIAGQLQRLVGPQRSPNDRTNPECLSELLDPPPVDAQVGVTDPRRRTNRHNVVGRTKMELEIVDESEQSTGALGMEVLRGLLDNGGAGEACHLLPDDAPGIFRRGGQGEGF